MTGTLREVVGVVAPLERRLRRRVDRGAAADGRCARRPVREETFLDGYAPENLDYGTVARALARG